MYMKVGHALADAVVNRHKRTVRANRFLDRRAEQASHLEQRTGLGGGEIG